MKKLLFLALALFAATAFSQSLTYIDSSYTVPAQAYAYKLDAAPVLDGSGSEWANLPWTQAYYNDRDRNNDALQDPYVSQTDYTPKFKAGWLENSNKLYFLVSFTDDKYFPKSKNPQTDNYNCDGFELRLDPLNAKKEGEVGDGSVHYVILEYGNDKAIGKDGYTKDDNYKAVWSVDTLSYPKRMTLELELTLQPTIALTDYYVMGFYPYFNDNDGAPGKVTAAVIWPQLWSAKNNARAGVDAAWEHTHLWGELVCVNQRVHEVAAGGDVQNAIDDANEGDIVHLGAGTYSGNYVVNNPGVMILGADAATTILQPADNALPVIDVKPGVYGVRVENLTFKGNLQDGGLVSQVGLKLAAGVSHVLNNNFYDFGTNAINCADNEGANIIDGNHINNIGSHAVVISNAPFSKVRNNLIEKGANKISSKQTVEARSAFYEIGYNVLRDFVSGSIGISYGVTTATKASGTTWLIHHNYIYATRAQRATGIYDFGDNCIENQENTVEGSVSYIFNNTMAFIKNAAIQMNGPAANKFYLKNNISAFNSRQREKNMSDYDVRPKPAGTDPMTLTIDHSLTMAEFGLRTIITEAPYNDATNIVDDPAFADTTADDLTLDAGSPAIDKGDEKPFGFIFGYAGTAPDMGAFEYGMPKITTAVEQKPVAVVEGFQLAQNYPNPFNPTTQIQFSVAKAGLVKLQVYNMLGQLAATVVDGHKAAGTYSVTFDAAKLPSGVYFYKLTAGDFSRTMKMMLMK